MRISDWSSDVCSSDLAIVVVVEVAVVAGLHPVPQDAVTTHRGRARVGARVVADHVEVFAGLDLVMDDAVATEGGDRKGVVEGKSVSVRLDIGGRRISNKKNMKKT